MRATLNYFFNHSGSQTAMSRTYFSNNNRERNYNSTVGAKQKQNSKKADKNQNFLESSK